MSAVLEVRLDDNDLRDDVTDEVEDGADNDTVERAPDEGVVKTSDGEVRSVDDSIEEACVLVLKDWGTRRMEGVESLCFGWGEDITVGVSAWAETREDQSTIFCFTSGAPVSASTERGDLTGGRAGWGLESSCLTAESVRELSRRAKCGSMVSA